MLLFEKKKNGKNLTRALTIETYVLLFQSKIDVSI